MLAAYATTRADPQRGSPRPSPKSLLVLSNLGHANSVGSRCCKSSERQRTTPAPRRERRAGLPPMLLGRRLGSELEAGADVHHRRAPRVDRADDLLDIDPLQVHAGGRDVRMPELPLDHR